MSKLKIKIKKFYENAVIPKYSSKGDAGMDLTAISEEWNENNTQVTYDTGISVEIPEGYVGLVFPRSSIYKTTLNLSNSVGIIDSGYRGSIKAKFNYFKEGMVYSIGDRILQLIVIPYPQIEFEEVSELSITERGAKGYGSSGN